jgi:hypothetical protein
VQGRGLCLGQIAFFDFGLDACVLVGEALVDLLTAGVVFCQVVSAVSAAIAVEASAPASPTMRASAANFDAFFMIRVLRFWPGDIALSSPNARSLSQTTAFALLHLQP